MPGLGKHRRCSVASSPAAAVGDARRALVCAPYLRVWPLVVTRPLSSPPAVAAAACLLAAVAAADDDVLPSVLMKMPLLMSSLQPSHLLELGEDDEARRTSGS